MRMIVALVQPERLDAVLEALTDVGVSGLTLAESRGLGRDASAVGTARLRLRPRVRLEIAVPADRLPTLLEALRGAAGGRTAGYGMLFVLELESALRIRTGERDHLAIGD